MKDSYSREMILRVTFSLLMFFILEDISIEGAIGPCENVAVNEGTLNTLINCPANRNGARWENLATTEELIAATIVDKNDAVDRSYSADYTYDPLSGLTILNATTTKAEPGRESTAGLYTVTRGGDQFSVKFLVVRQGPTCSCKMVGSSSVQLTCSSIYADSTYVPIAAIFTLYVNGNFKTSETPQRTNYDAWTWISTSTFTTDYADSSTYQCSLTFGQPTEVQDPIVAMNAPKFNHSCSVAASECRSTTANSGKTSKKPSPTATARPTTKTTKPPSTTTPTATSTIGCNCAQNTTTCASPDTNCYRASECPADGINMTDNSAVGFVKADLYVTFDKCCPKNVVWGVVVTLNNGSRLLIRLHDPLCNDNKCETIGVDASCMSSNWVLLDNSKITIPGFIAFLKTGNTVPIGLNKIDCSDLCKRMMHLL